MVGESIIIHYKYLGSVMQKSEFKKKIGNSKTHVSRMAFCRCMCTTNCACVNACTNLTHIAYGNLRAFRHILGKIFEFLRVVSKVHRERVQKRVFVRTTISAVFE